MRMESEEIGGENMDRRAAMLLGGTVLLVTTGARAQNTAADSTEVVTLWPGKAPGDTGAPRTLAVTERSPEPARYHDRAERGITTPSLTVYRPAQPNGAAILVMPGGGYDHLTVDKEGGDIARAFNTHGITGFVLRYRLAPEGWENSMDVAIQDAQRAMRLIRHRATDFGVDPARLGVMGFSAGGHLAATMATRGPQAQVYQPVDAADALGCRPDFAGLIYPGVMMGGGNVEPHPTPEMIAARAPMHHVTASVPPCFLCQNIDDRQVPVANLVTFFEELRKQKIPAALHLFETGGHGFGIRGALGTPTAVWPQLFLAWGKHHGFF